MCVSLWSDSSTRTLTVDYLQEIISFKSDHIAVVVQGFVRNLSETDQRLHFVHRRFVTPTDITESWIPQQGNVNGVTELFCRLYSNRVTVESKKREIKCRKPSLDEDPLAFVFEVLPECAKIPIGLKVYSDFRCPTKAEQQHVPYTSFALGPFRPLGETVSQAFRIRFDIAGTSYQQLVGKNHWGCPQYDIFGPRIVETDISLFDFQHIPKPLANEFEEYTGRNFERISEHRVPVGHYDVVCKDCTPKLTLVRLNICARELFVEGGLSPAVKWWRADDEQFMIQLVQSL
jgi:hypothetical protein